MNQHTRRTKTKYLGQGFVEYAFILSLVAVTAIVAVNLFGDQMVDVFRRFVSSGQMAPPSIGPIGGEFTPRPPTLTPVNSPTAVNTPLPGTPSHTPTVTPTASNTPTPITPSPTPTHTSTPGCAYGPYAVSNTTTSRIEAENFTCGGPGVAYSDTSTSNEGGAYRPNEQVDIQSTSDTGGGFNVGWTRDGEWLTYKLNVETNSVNTLRIRFASTNGSSRIRLFLDGVSIGGGLINLPNTGGTQNWQTFNVNNVALISATEARTLRVEIVNGYFNLNYFEFVPGLATFTPTPTPSPTATRTPTPTPIPPTNTPAPITNTFQSIDAEDGFIVEQNATGNGDVATSTGVIEIGDTAGNNANSRKQRKGILSFDTSSLPDNAIITSVTIRVNRDNINGNPSTLNPLTVDVAPASGFNGSYTLEKQDFQATASATGVATLPIPASNNTWTVSTTFNGAGMNAINKTGKTQIRIYFGVRTDGDSDNDKLFIKSGSSSSSKPELIITYTLP